MRDSDCFVFAFDGMMQRTGQGRHVSQSALELDRAPDVERIRAALDRVVAKYPLLVARHRRSWRNLMRYWQLPKLGTVLPGLPLGLWRETGAPGALAGEGVTEVPDAFERFQDFLAEPLARGGVPFNARVDVAERRDGTCVVALTWSHLVMDGKGAEFMLADLGRLCAGVDVPEEPARAPSPALPLKEMLLKTRPAMARFDELRIFGVPSLGGPKPRPGRGHYEIFTLTAAETATVRERSARLVGALFPVAFNIACVSRAHDRVFRHRGREPEGFAGSVLIQKRKRGARGPMFGNHVTVLYFRALRETLGSLEACAAGMRQQFADMTRTRISDAFDAILDLMYWLPSPLFMFMVRREFHGEITSFFHSHTGPFAPETTEFAGGRVLNAYHLPCIAAPPGTGIFLSEHGDRLNVTLSWREGCLTGEERRLMLDQFWADLLGGPPQPPAAPAAAILAHANV